MDFGRFAGRGGRGGGVMRQRRRWPKTNFVQIVSPVGVPASRSWGWTYRLFLSWSRTFLRQLSRRVGVRATYSLRGAASPRASAGEPHDAARAIARRDDVVSAE